MKALSVGILLMLMGILSIAGLSGSTQAQSRSSTPSALPSDAFSPEQIAAYIEEQSRWRNDTDKTLADRVDALHLAVANLWITLRIPDIWGGECLGCGAGIKRMDLNHDPFPDAALEITSAEDYRYLLFIAPRQSSVKDWTFLGYVDSATQHYSEPEIKTVRIGSRTWFVIEETWNRGTGVGLDGQRWFEITPGKIVPALRFPTQGHDVPWPSGLSRDFHARIIEQRETAQGHRIVIQFEISYWFGTFDPKATVQLFSRTQRGTFMKKPTDEKFELVPSQSTLSSDEIAQAYSVGDSLNDSQFLVYNVENLSQIARSGSRQQKEWLAGFLTTVPASPQKATVSRILNAR